MSTTGIRTLVVAPAWVGDLVMSQPLLVRLEARHPGGQVDMLAPAFLASLCTRLPGVSRVHTSPLGHGDLGLRARWRLGRALAAEGYQHVVVLPNSFKSALVPRFAGIAQRTGYVGEARHGLLNDVRKLDKAAVPRMVDRYYRLGFAPGEVVRPAPNPRLAANRSAVQGLLDRLGLNDGAAPPVPVILCPGAEYGPAKRWPARHFGAVAGRLLARQIPVWIMGSGKDHAVAEDIRAAVGAGAAVNLCGATSLADAVDLMALAQGVVTNDSGLMHVAAALGVRTVAVFGSSSAQFTPPLSDRATALSLNLECSPCFKRECPLGHLDCLESLGPDRVLAALSGPD